MYQSPDHSPFPPTAADPKILLHGRAVKIPLQYRFILIRHSISLGTLQKPPDGAV